MPKRTPLAALAVVVALLVSLGVATTPSASAADDPVPTTTTLTTRDVEFDDVRTVTATVTSPAGTPTGAVHFTIGGSVIGDAAVDASGFATVTFTEPGPGAPYPITGAFHATDRFADSSGTTWAQGLLAGVYLDPDPTVLRLVPPRLSLTTLTMAAHARRADGRPIAGLELVFKIGGERPTLFDFGGGKVVCGAVTDANGFASCRGTGGFSALESISTGGGWVAHFRFGYYDFAAEKVPVLAVGGL